MSLDTDEKRKDLFSRIIKDQLNVRQAEQLASQLKNSPDKEKVVKQSIIPNHVKKAQQNLSNILNVNVEIKTSANGKKGKIVLDFKNEEELESILAHIR